MKREEFQGRTGPTLLAGRLQTRGSAEDGRGEKEELFAWSVHVEYHQREVGRQFKRKVR
jgi:hypothetical protein